MLAGFHASFCGQFSAMRSVLQEKNKVLPVCGRGPRSPPCMQAASPSRNEAKSRSLLLRINMLIVLGVTMILIAASINTNWCHDVGFIMNVSPLLRSFCNLMRVIVIVAVLPVTIHTFRTGSGCGGGRGGGGGGVGGGGRGGDGGGGGAGGGSRRRKSSRGCSCSCSCSCRCWCALVVFLQQQ